MDNIMGPKRYSIYFISTLIDKEDRNLLFSQFLDDFYRAETDIDKYNLIKDEPIYDSNAPVFMSMLACSVEKLSHKYNLNTPEWVYDQKYFLDSACYALDTADLNFQKYLIETTPVEYKKRNLYYGDNVLSRC